MAGTTLPALTNLPRAVTCDGMAVSCWPLTVNAIAEWDQWARTDFLESAMRLCASLPDWKDRTEYRTTAMEESRRLSLGSPKAFGAMTSVPGKLMVCWLSMRQGPNAALTREEAWKLIGGETPTGQSYRNLNTVFAAAMVASGFAEEKDGDADPTTLVTRLIDLMMVR